MNYEPGKVPELLGFMDKFELILDSWSKDSRWPVTKIAQFSCVEIPKVVEVFADCLDRQIDIHDPLTKRDCEKVLQMMQTRLDHIIETRRFNLERRQSAVRDSYNDLSRRLLQLQKEKQWHSVYRSVCYFFGAHVEDIPLDLQLILCNEALRSGEKARINMQELAGWMRRSVELCLTNPWVDGLEEAIDFVETYGHLFTKDLEKSQKGLYFINSLLSQLQTAVTDLQSATRVETLIMEINRPATIGSSAA